MICCLAAEDGTLKLTSSTDVSPTSTPCGTPLGGAPKYGTVIPNRIFVGGIAANTTEQELKQFFSAYGAVKDSKIIADRAGVSKGYGFITFENQEDADRIIKKEVNVESDNLVFRDRKLNIGPAIRKQQVLPRAFESPVSPGAVMFSNGVPYTYQNGMAVFASPEAGYAAAVQQAQAQAHAQSQAALMAVPQTPPIYVQPQYTYQMPLSYTNQLQTSPQWATTAAAAAAATGGQWRYMTQSPTTALTATANPYMIAMQPDMMYAQFPQAYGGTELAELDGAAGVEGSILPVEEKLPVSKSTRGYATECSLGSTMGPTTVGCVSSVSAPLVSLMETFQTQNPVPVTSTAVSSATMLANLSTVPVVNTSMQNAAVTQTISSSPPAATTLTSKLMHSVCNVNVTPYKKPVASLARRPTYTTPTFLIRNGHKVQCVMVPPKTLTSTGHHALLPHPPQSDTTPASGVY
ncbi:mucin-5AC-like isoform X3 [Mya arenaria]|uniref:mucin-5AC-like isoform X3 n=1 Tax=Mya arenaria TaxID=6604 RepID=UPI0022E1759C|nr:mucin-5AC-like isoform X3 [Mya arenaria]